MSSGPPPGPEYVAASSSPSVVVVAGPIRPGDAPGLCERVLAARAITPTVVVDVSGVTGTDLATIDALARMQLAARRAGGRIRLRDPSPKLALLIQLAGLAGVLRAEAPGADDSGVEVLRDAEQREPPLAEVQEAVESGDPAL
ncbi:STAS domain-containing protein [Streptomyces sp. KL116D]|uniref:STAS domain-containing protein n=1 Tax=Streptomyces sp. KL116D TaxID=3045152 RepID=UPI003557C2DC